MKAEFICTKPRAHARCQKCAECNAYFAKVNEIGIAGGSTREMAAAFGVSKMSAANLWHHWKRRRAISLGIAVKPRKRFNRASEREPMLSGPRLRCACGLTVDKDHAADKCDMGLTTTGLGSQAGLVW